MSELSPEAIKRHVKVYVLVFMALAFLTVLTVGVSYMHLALVPAITVALTIAIIKGGLVAAFFMHLSSERRIIYGILILAVIFFFCLLILPTIT